MRGLRSDSDRIRTCDPQLRRLLLYPAELRNHCYFRGTKVQLFIDIARDVLLFIITCKHMHFRADKRITVNFAACQK